MVVRGFCTVLRDAKRIPYKYEIQILLVGDGLPVPKFLLDKLEFGGMFDIDTIKDVQSLPCLKGGWVTARFITPR